MLKRKKCYNIIYYKLTTLVFLYKEMPKIQKIDENSCYWQRKSSYLLNNLRNFNAIFRKGTTYGNIKSHKKTGFHPLLRRYIFGKTTIGGQLPPTPPPPLAILELKRLLFINSEKFHCYVSNQKATLYWSLLLSSSPKDSSSNSWELHC